MNKTVGDSAEDRGAEYLLAQDFQIISRNWRTRRCEIDIVASKDEVIYFVEVKYRSSPLSGGAIEYVTATKLRQMIYAAQLWTSRYTWTGDYRLAVIAVDGAKLTWTPIDF